LLPFVINPPQGATISAMIEWTPALSTSVALLDEQHKELFQWLAELQSAADDERTLFGVYSLTRLKHYTRAHFVAEEALMKAAEYPGLAEHAAEHAAFRRRLDELQLRSIGQDISTDTVEFLTNWLTTHITKTDMAYVPYLKKPK
jgi:hemerythrin